MTAPQVTHFTTPEGIAEAHYGYDEVTITLMPDGEDRIIAINIPRFKFEWIVRDFIANSAEVRSLSSRPQSHA